MPIPRSFKIKTKQDVSKLEINTPCPQCGYPYLIKVSECDNCSNRLLLGNTVYQKPCTDTCNEVYVSSKQYTLKLKCPKCNYRFTRTSPFI